MTHLPYGRQTIDDEDIAAVVEALRAPLLTCGPLVARFEAALAHWLGAPHATVCASGTAALHLAYAALGIGAGDEIITTPITFSATAAAAYYVGATVRIADVDPRTGNLTPASVEPLINRRTRAIVPVHLAGLPADLAELSALAHRHGLRIIEDACHALGARYRGVPIGAGASDAVVFSFHPVKHITTGEGGAVITRDPDVRRRIERLRQHGIERDHARLDAPAGPWVYEVQELGWNYRLSDLACALGLAQLTRLDGFLAARRRLAAHYRAELVRAFGAGAGVTPPAELADRESAYHLFAVAIDFERFATTRARVMAALSAAGIATQVHYIPLLRHPLHARRCPDEVSRARPGATRYYGQTLSLPLYPALTAADVSRVVGELHHALGGLP
ncbi:MAG TPA: UDP-4-amino-4,6-dideoxy-N-acetyl-beta-L-altrosamine transaminase [Kofleriaceae bacterium]|jgi:UDP-4-amino-4,6-dideoxy-N-acetyl-beta-L-altrosamine transaminase|nr:UDP-4-amino-4,6-dideoxy-N-acetyl-beta-L-altrosamine transaminase [Kofleriaceae bacterium]